MENTEVRKVPELSLLSYVNGDKRDQVKFVDNLMYGLKEYGFITLTDHLISPQQIDRAYELVGELFSLPLDVKDKYCDEKGGGQRGYTPFGREHAKDNKNPDLKEFWHVGRTLSEQSAYKGVYPENVWPTELKEFQSAFTKLYTDLDKTSQALLEAIGRGLDVPQDFFTNMIHDGNSILRLIHYPPVVGQDTKNSIRAAAHEDINLITLLLAATDSGLELLDRDGSWLKIDSNPGQIIVDTGDMIQRLTNNVLPATTHRVVNPENADTTRYSMPFFVHPHSKASLACLPSCLGEGKKYEDITAGEFLQQRLKEIGLY